MTVATDGGGDVRQRAGADRRPRLPGRVRARPTRPRSSAGGCSAAGTDDLLETTRADRDRIFNLGYYTWVEQQGVSLADFEARRDQRFWTGLRDLLAGVGRDDRGVQRPDRPGG